MLSFLADLFTNPTFLSALTLAATWTYHKLRGDTQDSIVELATSIARNAVQDLAGSPDWSQRGAMYIEDKVIGGIADKFGWSTGRLEPYMPILHPVIEHALADLKAEVQRRLEAKANADAQAKIQSQLDALALAAVGVRQAFNPPPTAATSSTP